MLLLHWGWDNTRNRKEIWLFYRYEALVGYLGFDCDQNNHNSSNAFTNCIHYKYVIDFNMLESFKISKTITQIWAYITRQIFFAYISMSVVDNWTWIKPNLSSMADSAIAQSGRGLGSSFHIYRLITAYLLLRVNLDKIMHARWDFYASSARTRRVSALDKHQNWSASALFCLNSRAQSKYAVVNLIHTRRKQTFLSFIMW